MSRFPEWKLPDDGITDHLAIAVTVRGDRRVRLTQQEMMLAAREIVANGGTPKTLAENIGCTIQYARKIHKMIRNGDGEGSG